MLLTAVYKQRRLVRLGKLLTVVGAGVAIALVSGFVWVTRSPIDLGHAGKASRADWTRAWQAGEVVALVRHAERCDRSDHLCLGPEDGITQVGNDSAVRVGKGFKSLGMQQAQVFTSPLTRTVQTARAMFGQDATAQPWLESCGSSLRNEVVAHKVAQRNLVLVTHSGCISDFEKQTGFPHAIAADYGSTLFVRIDAKGQLEVLGILNAEAWSQLNSD
ncbi:MULTISPECIES: histidine phosphatase family protein [Pseudomonas]|uniref:lipopolysaccharide core heptose(II)-phosphate phosphatase PmrG n=1 Tax=Pseudomonas TaxID=286 RepID=UPI00191E1DDF|nr:MULTISPECIES: histidine phosphatase family protein [Pseudomonas]MBL0796499.1 histidine phosphatase family protein [Pseudomonas sp. B7]MBX8621316.1 histidine phosphatase family protein [Pseudomonas glycinae]